VSLRYKILAAVIFITVVILTVVLVVVLFELVRTQNEFAEFDRNLRQRTIHWVRQNLELVDDENSPVRQLDFLREIFYVKGEAAGNDISIIKGREPSEENVVHIRGLVRRLIRNFIENPAHNALVEGNDFAIAERGEMEPAARGAFYFTLDIPRFNPHEPLRQIYIVMLLGIVLIILVMYYVLSRSVIRPLERLNRATERVAKGDYTRPVPQTGRDDELDMLTATFNSMMVDLGNFRHHLEERAGEARAQARQAEKTLVIAQRLAATGKLASGIAHEVNNPLGGMLNAARRLLRDPPGDEKRIEYLNLIIDGLTRVQETVKKILRFTPHKVAPQPVEMETVLRRALALASHRIEREGTDVVVDMEAGARVFGDPFELQQVFLNILINALDAIAATDRKGEISIRGFDDRNLLRIIVKDNGCGFETDDFSQAFDLFYTTKEVGEGTGLGLSIAHNVIQNHGGSLRLGGVPGEGAEVEIALPLLTGSE
jgi:signal transduction histidine kinase